MAPQQKLENFRHTTEIYGKKAGDSLSPSLQLTNNICHDVEIGAITTVAGLVAKYGNIAKLRRNIGRAINQTRWEIDGVMPNNVDGRQTDRTGNALNDKLGAEIIVKHAGKAIMVLGERNRLSECESKQES